jgi:WD40 repeat protein
LDNGDNYVYTSDRRELIVSTNHFPENRCFALSHRTDFKPSIGKFSPRGNFYLTTGNDGRLCVYHLNPRPSGKLTPQFVTPIGLPVYCAEWSEDEKSIMVGTVEGHLHRYHLGKGIDPRFSLKLHDAPSQVLEFREDGLMLIASIDGKLWACDAETGIALGLPYGFDGTPEIWRFDSKSGVCAVFSKNTGMLWVDVLPAGLPELRRLIGLSIDDGDTPKMIPYSDLPALIRTNHLAARPEIRALRFDPTLLPNPQPKSGNALSGKWVGSGEDVNLGTWRFALQLRVDEDNSVKGTFEWIEILADGTEQPAGKENTAGHYDPDEHVLHMHSLEVESTYGLGGFVWYKAYVSDEWNALKNGRWGRRGHVWGLYSGQKTPFRHIGGE